jgi:hypothetical protein
MHAHLGSDGQNDFSFAREADSMASGKELKLMVQGPEG